MADGAHLPRTGMAVDDLLVVSDTYRRKHGAAGFPPIAAARGMLAAAVHLFATHAGAAEAAAVCAETVAQIRAAERLARMDG